VEGDELAGDAADWLLRELGGKHRSQVLSTLAAVGVADVLQERGACSAADLAAQAGCELGALESLLRAAAGMGCLTEPSPGSFSLTPRGEQLCSDRLGAFADFLGSRTQWDAWSRLRDAMRDQDPASPLARALGRPLYEHLAADPAAAADYDAAIDAFTRHEAAQLRGRLDLQGVRAIVDVGGGRGTLLRALLEQADGARGVLFDLPHVVDGVRAALPPTIEAVSGDFLEAVPAGGDLYLLKHVLHNWADDEARRILQHCRDARVEGGRVVVLDAVLAPDNRPDLARMLDLEMRVLCGGRERRKPELRRLLQSAGLKIEAAVELAASSWMFVCR
jgi:SAM-dependent methyltransferase